MMLKYALIFALATGHAVAQGFAIRVRCETQSAGAESLRDMTWQQGTTPLIQLDVLSNGRPFAADTNSIARLLIAPSATSAYYVDVTNQTYGATSYSIQMPTIGTNTASSAWWYTVYFEKNGLRYWTGNGVLTIEETTSTAPDGLVWQLITQGISDADSDGTLYGRKNGAWEAVPDAAAETDPVAYPVATNALAQAQTAQAAAQAAVQVEADPIWAGVSNVVTAGAAAGATAWQNPSSATNWTWTSDGTQITLTGYSGPNDVVIPDKLDNLPVTGFEAVFSENASITSVSGGENIGSIEYAAFSECYGLSIVNLSSATNIGSFAFYACINLTSVHIPSATTIGSSAFQESDSLANVTFAQNAPTIGNDIFLDAPNVIVYVTNPTATGWGATLGGRPVVRLPVSADAITLGGDDLAGLLGDKADASDLAGYATTNQLTAALDTYRAWTAEITPASGTATVTRAHGTHPRVTLDGPTVLTFDPSGYSETSGVHRVALSMWAGTNAVTFASANVTWTGTPSTSTNDWTSVLIRKTGASQARGAVLP
jgi:hypothetical protein